MKRQPFINAILLLCLAGGGSARAQDTNGGPGRDFDSFRIIVRKNIFDASRRGGLSRPTQHVPKIDTIVFDGAAVDHGKPAGFFGGAEGPLKPGDSVDGLKVVQINLDYAVLLSGSNSYVLKKDGDSALRREDNGPWEVTEAPETEDQPAVRSTDSGTTVASTSTSSASTPSNANESDVLKRLRERREQEDK